MNSPCFSCCLVRTQPKVPPDPPPSARLAGTNAFGIEDLTIYAHYHLGVIVGGGSVGGAGEIFIRRVRIRANVYMGYLQLAQVDPLARLTDGVDSPLPTQYADTIKATKNGVPGVMAWQRWAVHRENRLDSNARVEVLDGTDVVIESNVVEKADVGIYIDKNSTGILLHNNSFHDVAQPVQDDSGHPVTV